MVCQDCSSSGANKVALKVISSRAKLREGTCKTRHPLLPEGPAELFTRSAGVMPVTLFRPTSKPTPPNSSSPDFFWNIHAKRHFCLLGRNVCLDLSGCHLQKIAWFGGEQSGRNRCRRASCFSSREARDGTKKVRCEGIRVVAVDDDAASPRKRRKAGPFFNGPAFLSLWGHTTARTS